MHALVALLATLLLASSGGPVQAGEDEILAQLSKLRLDKNRIYLIRDITIRRDTLSISFNRGTIVFLEAVMGQVTGAIFLGSGEILSIPPDPSEKRQLIKFTESPILNERFDAGMFRFTDDTYAEIITQYEERAREDVPDDAFSELLPWEENLGERSHLLNLRLLADLIGNDDRPLFYSELRGTRLGWFNAVYDQRLAEEVTLVRSGVESDSGISDIWTSYNRRSEARDPEESAHEDPAFVDITAYDIDATILPDSRLDAVARLTLTSRATRRASPSVRSHAHAPTVGGDVERRARVVLSARRSRWWFPVRRFRPARRDLAFTHRSRAGDGPGVPLFGQGSGGSRRRYLLRE